MPEGELVVSKMYDATLVRFRKSSLLDALAVEAVAQELYELVDQQARRKILLDFSGVRLLSSSMLGVLVNLNKRAAGIGGKLVIVGLRPDLKKVFQITRLDKILAFADEESEGLTKLGAR